MSHDATLVVQDIQLTELIKPFLPQWHHVSHLSVCPHWQTVPPLPVCRLLFGHLFLNVSIRLVFVSLQPTRVDGRNRRTPNVSLHRTARLLCPNFRLLCYILLVNSWYHIVKLLPVLAEHDDSYRLYGASQQLNSASQPTVFWPAPLPLSWRGFHSAPVPNAGGMKIKPFNYLLRSQVGDVVRHKVSFSRDENVDLNCLSLSRERVGVQSPTKPVQSTNRRRHWPTHLAPNPCLNTADGWSF